MDTPRRRSWFAVWNWPTWTWGVIAALMVAYPLSYAPVARFKMRCFEQNESVDIVVRAAYHPVRLGILHVDPIRVLYELELDGVMWWEKKLMGPQYLDPRLGPGSSASPGGMLGASGCQSSAREASR